MGFAVGGSRFRHGHGTDGRASQRKNCRGHSRKKNRGRIAGLSARIERAGISESRPRISSGRNFRYKNSRRRFEKTSGVAEHRVEELGLSPIRSSSARRLGGF